MNIPSRGPLVGLLLMAAAITIILVSSQEALAAGNPTVAAIECKTFLGFSGTWSKEVVQRKAVHLARSIAARLSYYSSEGGNAVFAPRDWKCRSWAGVGSVMIIVPRGTHVPSESKLQMTTGPAVTAASASGETSGRFTVVKYASWYFSRVAEKYIRTMVKSEGDVPYPLQAGPNPYPHDEVTHLTPMLVRVITPPNSRGFGTEGLLAVGDRQVVSFVKLTLAPDPGMVIIRIRLPASMHSIEGVMAQMDSKLLRH